jgi:CRISPR/Cas system-associated protein Csx1
VAEGVQILDETLFYNNKKALRNKPLIVMDTSIEDSILSRSIRDNKSIDKLLEPERRKQLEGWLRDKDILKKEMSDIK